MSPLQSTLTMNNGVITDNILIEGDLAPYVYNGLLMTLPIYKHDSILKFSLPLKNKRKARLDIGIISNRGINISTKDYKSFKISGRQKFKTGDITVEGDFLDAAYFLVAGALGSFVTCAGIATDSKQANSEILRIIDKAGGQFVSEHGKTICLPSNLKGRHIDLAELPSLLPIAAVFAAFCEGETVISLDKRLKTNERSRYLSIVETLNSLGAAVIMRNDGLVIHGRAALSGGELNCGGDPEIAKALLVLATRCASPLTIVDCPNDEGFKGFCERFRVLGGEIS